MKKLQTIDELIPDEDISDVVDGDEELEGYSKGWKVGVMFAKGMIKVESKKWIKSLNECEDREEIEKVTNYGAFSFPCETEAQIKWIKHFNNLEKG